MQISLDKNEIAPDMTDVKTQQENTQEKFKSAPIKSETAQNLREINRLTGIPLYRIIQNLVDAELTRLQASMSSPPQSLQEVS